MSAVLKMSDQLTLEGIDAAISLPASADGQRLFDSLDGPQIVKSGPAVVRASLSPRQAKAMGLMTSGTYGRAGSISLSSAALQSSLVSRLMQRFATGGSTLFHLTWKELATPSHRPYFLLRASVPRRDATGFSSWPTPMAGSPARNGYNEAGNNDSSRKTVALCNWATPAAREAGGTPEQFLARKAALNGACGISLTSLSLQAQLAVSGETPTGSTAPITNTGQLNPGHSRWLMGYRRVWDDCGVMAMQSFPSSRRNSSART